VIAGAVLAAFTLAYGALAPSARIPEMPSPPASA